MCEAGWRMEIIRLIVRHIQPNPKSEVQISIGKSFSAAFKEASFVAIQLPRWPPFSSGLTMCKGICGGRWVG